jgi:hypothetical protein
MQVNSAPCEASMLTTVVVLLKSTRDLNPNIATDGQGSFRFKWPLILNTSNKMCTLKNVYICLLPKVIFFLEINRGRNPNNVSQSG